jgi:hypothetical protein
MIQIGNAPIRAVFARDGLDARAEARARNLSRLAVLSVPGYPFGCRLALALVRYAPQHRWQRHSSTTRPLAASAARTHRHPWTMLMSV